MTRTVRDSAALLEATSAPDPGASCPAPIKERSFLEDVGSKIGALKIGFLSAIPRGWHAECGVIHPECRYAVEDGARLCEDLGHLVEEIDPEELSFPDLYRGFGIIWCSYLVHVIQRWEKILGREITGDHLEAHTWTSYRAGLKRTGGDYLTAVSGIQRFSRKMAQWYDCGGYDMILSPTTILPPVKLGAFQGTPQDPMMWARMSGAFLAMTYAYNLTGQPAMSVPLFWTGQGVPIGVQFAGRYGEEALLIRLASQLEEARPWAERIPNLKGKPQPQHHCEKE
ncbi:MAG: amidase [Deltaproteobacteria bacterium]|nr:amidase [Deltaproteobacteria bacterium]